MPVTELGNLPPQLTSFVGREREIVDVIRLLDKTRLLTLTGAGGVGKTRLAVQVARLLAYQYADGVLYVGFENLQDGTLLPQEIASVLGVREEPDRPILATLANYLAPRTMLLVLDNCEHLIDSCASLCDTLLRLSPGLKILTTSRQPLDMECELSWRVPSLALPDSHQTLAPEELARYEAVQLFAERAAFRKPDFALTPANTEQVSRLCSRLDGVPLAIELAAARVRILSVEQILERLDERFRLLSTGSPTAATRHRTLAAMIDWSYDFLSPAEQALLRGLAVFAGSFTLEAVENVCGVGQDRFELIDLLTQLVDKSLVNVEDTGGPVRYRLLEIIRRYAWGKAVSGGEADALNSRHLDWFRQLAEHTEDQLLSNAQVAWLQRLDAEHDNLRAALACARESNLTEDRYSGLRLAGALVWFWYFRGHLTEGRNSLEGILTVSDPSQRTVHRAKALSAAGALAYLQSDFAPSRTHLDEGLEIWRELGDKRGTAFTLTFVGRLLSRDGDPEGRELGEEAVRLFREIGEEWGLALALDFLGEEAQQQGDSVRANALHDESLALYREMGHSWGVALELSHFGRVALQQGDFDTARRQLQEAIVIQREVGDRWALAWTLYNLGDALRYEGDVEQAEPLYRDSVALFRELGDRGGVGGVLHTIGYVAYLKGDLDQARSLADESVNILRVLGDRWALATGLNLQGMIATASGDYGEAERLHRESLALAAALGDRSLIAECLEGLAGVCAGEENWETSAKLYGAASTLRPSNGVTPAEARLRAAHLERVRDALGAEAYEVAMSAGRDMTPVQAVALATGEALPAAAAPSQEAAAEPGDAETVAPVEEVLPGAVEPLTKREIEVLRLIAEGLTASQVAERLVVSTRTVQAHVRSLYSKLGITTRSAATRYVIEHKLL